MHPTVQDSSPGLLRQVAVAVVTVGALLALVRGVVLALLAARRTGTWLVHVPVWPTDAMAPDGWEWTVAHGIVPLQPTGSSVRLYLQDTDAWTAALATAPGWVVWPTAGLAGLLLVPTVRRLVARAPLRRADAWRVLALAGLVVAAWGAAYGLPMIAAERAIAAEDSGLPASWFVPHFDPQGWPLVVAALLVVLAGSVRHGARAAADVEGLV